MLAYNEDSKFDGSLFFTSDGKSCLFPKSASKRTTKKSHRQKRKELRFALGLIIFVRMRFTFLCFFFWQRVRKVEGGEGWFK